MKHFCPECEEETECSHICNVYSCSKCGKDFDCYENLGKNYDEVCLNCKFHLPGDNKSIILCRRYPDYREKSINNWCGEWQMMNFSQEVKTSGSITEIKMCSNCSFHKTEMRSNLTYCDADGNLKWKNWNDVCNKWEKIENGK